MNRRHRDLRASSARSWLSAAASGLVLLTAAPSFADVPVSVGNRGAAARAQLTQGAARQASAASFGSPQTDGNRLFQLRWRMPFWVYGDEAEGVTPFQVAPAATKVLDLDSVAPGVLPQSGANLALEQLDDARAYIPQLEVGEERGAFHMQAGVLSANVGHGSVVHQFTNSPEGTLRRFGLLLEANASGIGGQVMVGDLLAPQSFAGARVYGRPIMWFTSTDTVFQPNGLDVDPRGELLGMWMTGLTVASDVMAPGGAFMLEQRAATDFAPVYVVGWDNEFSVLDNQLVKLGAYLDLNVMGGTAAGIGQTPLGVGAHPGARFLLDLPIARLELSGEYNVGSDGYVPRYFDRLYMVERNNVFGTGRNKARLDTPASHGYLMHAAATLWNTVSLFGEWRDQFPFNWDRGANSAALTLGGSFFFQFIGANMTVSQAGIQSYTEPDFFGQGFVFTAEGRIALVGNILHLIGRYYRIHNGEGPHDKGLDYELIEGSVIGMELNLDFF